MGTNREQEQEYPRERSGHREGYFPATHHKAATTLARIIYYQAGNNGSRDTQDGYDSVVAVRSEGVGCGVGDVG